MKAGSGWNAASKEDLASSRKGMEQDKQDDGCGARERRTRSGFTALGSGQARKESAMTGTSSLGRRRTPRKVSVEEDRGVFKGLRQVPLTPRSAGRSKLFGRLHAQVFGSEAPQEPTLSHPLQASPERRRTPTKARRSLAKSPKQQQRTSPRVSTRSQRPPPSSSWLSPYCKQYMVNPVPQARHQTPLQKLHHISNAKDLHLSPPRSATLELDFDHVASPIRGTLDKENSPTQTMSLDGQVRTAPSMESLESTPDGVLSVLGEQSSQAWREMR